MKGPRKTIVSTSLFSFGLFCAFFLSFISLALDGTALQQDENSNAILVASANNNSGKALSVGRRWIYSASRNIGWLTLMDLSSGLADTNFNLPDSAAKNINVSTAPTEPGSIYLDLSNSTKESLCTSTVWDNSNSVWWVACRSF